MTSTSKWRKQETFKSNTNPSSKPDNFSNIPMFDVLQNTKDTNNETKETPIVEGFDWQGNGYFHHRGIYGLTKDNSKFREYIEKLMSYLSSPITKLDSMLEGFIYDMLIMFLMLNHLDCNDSNSYIRASGSAAEQAFFWAQKQMPREREGFSLNEQPYLMKTIDSFEKNHIDFVKDTETKAKMGAFYIRSLNAYETRLRRRMTEEELFLFNNDFDNLLNDPTIQQKIRGIIPNNEWKSQFDLSSMVIYQNTESDYKKYYDKTARFKMDNTDRISYYPLNDGYFALPQKSRSGKSGMEVFDILLSESDESSTMLTKFELVAMNNKRNNKNRLDMRSGAISFTTPSNPQSRSTAIEPKDFNYVFSVDVNTPIEQSVEEYLFNVIKRFSLLVYSKITTSTQIRNLGFQEIQARIGTIYTDLLNRLEFLHYNQYQDYLDSYRIAIFNHMFYVFIQQQNTGDTYSNGDNIYVSSFTKSDDIFTKIITANNVRYSYLKDDVDETFSQQSLLDSFPSVNEKTQAEWNNTNTNTWEDTTSKNYDDGSITYTGGLEPFNNKETYGSNRLSSYILENEYKSKEMEKYFIPGQMSECERLKRSKRKEFTKYAKIIKKEIYRLLLIPVVLYVVYNIYYIFFFRDVEGRVKFDNGEYINKGFACKNPLFPDWESYFHSYDNHNTDLILEYVFKPAKMMYTLLNALKAGIRWSSLDNIIPPYIWLFSCVLAFYHIFNKHGTVIMKFYNDFYNKMAVPFVKVMKVDSNTRKTFNLPKERGNWIGYNEIAKIITFIFCGLSAIKDIGGFNWHQILQSAAVSPEANEKMFNDNKEPEVRSWLAWLISTPTFIIMFFKFIIFILYWIFKYYLAFAMVPLASFIAVIYITYNMFFAIYNNSNSECDYSTKMELIDRIIYTKLYDVPKNPKGWEYVKYIFKSTCWIIMFFITELLSIYVLSRGLKTILKNITGSTQADGIKTFLFTVYMCIFVLIGLWCVYKYKFKLPIQETFFSNEKDRGKPDVKDDDLKHKLSKPPLRTEFYETNNGTTTFDNPAFMKAIDDFIPTGKEKPDPTYYKTEKEVTEVGKDGSSTTKTVQTFNEFKYLKDIDMYKKWEKINNAKDKRFTLEKNTNCDTYEILTENNPKRIIFGSDILNKIVIKEEIERTKKLLELNKGQPSFADKWSSKIIGTMGNFGDKLLQKGQNVMENLNTPASDGPSILDKAKDLSNFATEGMNYNPVTWVTKPIERIGKATVQSAQSAQSALPTVSGVKEGIGAIAKTPSNVFDSVLNSDTTKFIGDSIKDKASNFANIFTSFIPEKTS
jgi:hypothetical protein